MRMAAEAPVKLNTSTFKFSHCQSQPAEHELCEALRVQRYLHHSTDYDDDAHTIDVMTCSCACHKAA